MTWRILIQVLWTTGARISEVLALEAHDLLKMDHNFFLRIQRLKRRQPHKELLPIPIDLALKLQDFVRLKESDRSDLLFPLSRNQVYRRCVRWGKQSLGKHVHPHMFRHGRVYDLALRKKSPFLIARIVGHANIQTTMAYFHPSDQDLKEALEE